MADVLTRFLHEAAKRKFAWGQADCLLWLAPWVRLCRGVDAAGALAGTYATARQAMRLVQAAGGMTAMLAGAVEPLGIARTDRPRRGDIAIAQGPEGEIGGIVLGRMVACFAGPGLFVRPLPIVAAWRV